MSSAAKYACGHTNCSTDARTRYNEGIVLAMECEDTFTASDSGEETCLAEDYTKRARICL